MMKKKLFFLLSFLCLFAYANCKETPPLLQEKSSQEGGCPVFHKDKKSLQVLYKSLDPLSVKEHLAFFELYPNTEEGKIALSHAWELLAKKSGEQAPKISLPVLDIRFLVSLVNQEEMTSLTILSQEQLLLIEDLGKNLSNRKLKGHGIWTEKELLVLPPEELDLARGLLVAELGTAKEKIRQYEASLDLMALQILARLPTQSSPRELIEALNHFIFFEMLFRFPPRSSYAKEIDTYTFLPSVIDKRRGVCLGVSILYLALAQRLGLNLEAVTPPGHIFVRFQEKPGEFINIETTARGINLPDEKYLSIDTRKLQTHNLKEVIGLAFMNQASVALTKENYPKVVELYQKAFLYLPQDPHLCELMGYSFLLAGKKKEGRKLLEKIRNFLPEEAISIDPTAEDLLKGYVTEEGIKTLFLPVDETRESILNKQKKLQKILLRFPKFRSGWLQLASTFLQLDRKKEALSALKKYFAIDSEHAVVNYYIAAIAFERFDYNLAWKHLKKAEKITALRNHDPEALKDLKEKLRKACPEPA